MATKKEINIFLKSNNLTESDMDNYWYDLRKTNWIVKNISEHGKSWRDMNMTVISQVPTQRQRDIESEERKKKESEDKKDKKLREKQEEEYYESHFEEVMLKKIDNSEELTERELSRLAYEHEVDHEEGNNRRWSRTITSYVQLQDRFFVVNWEQGLTESQDNEFYDQPYEVEKQIHEEIIPEHKVVTTNWVRTNK